MWWNDIGRVFVRWYRDLYLSDAVRSYKIFILARIFFVDQSPSRPVSLHSVPASIKRIQYCFQPQCPQKIEVAQSWEAATIYSWNNLVKVRGWTSSRRRWLAFLDTTFRGISYRVPACQDMPTTVRRSQDAVGKEEEQYQNTVNFACLHS